MLTGWSAHRTASQSTRAIVNTLRVYTFSFTTDWFHTVNAVAPTTAPAPATRRLRPAADTIGRNQRSPMRNHRPAATALVVAARVSTYNTRAPSATRPASR